MNVCSAPSAGRIRSAFVTETGSAKSGAVQCAPSHAIVWAYLEGLDLRETTAAALRAGKATVEYPGTNNPDLGVLVHG